MTTNYSREESLLMAGVPLSQLLEKYPDENQSEEHLAKIQYLLREIKDIPHISISNKNNPKEKSINFSLRVADVTYKNNIAELYKKYSTNTQLLNQINNTINILLNCVVEANRYLSNKPIIIEMETLTMFYHYNDFHRICVFIS